MLKQTEETVVFFVTFLSLVAFQLGAGRSLLATPMVKSMQAGSSKRPCGHLRQLHQIAILKQ